MRSQRSLLAAAPVLAALLAEPATVSGQGDEALGSVCALPVILRSGLRDIHESRFNGPEGYAFFAEAGAEKRGDLPRAVGEGPVREFDTDVYASNFQGPVAVRHPGLRPQWEWTTSGELQISDRTYPVMIARSCAENARALPSTTLHVDEHDEPPLRNDAVGAFRLELSACEEVVSGTRVSGWTRELRSDGMPYRDEGGPADVDFVEYLLWCYRCESAQDCERSIVWGVERPAVDEGATGDRLDPVVAPLAGFDGLGGHPAAGKIAVAVRCTASPHGA